jgi:hypothetical protein
MNFVKQWGLQQYTTSQVRRKQWASQPVSCEMCGSDRNMTLDHCHLHGWIRGWLCHMCNVNLALVEKNIYCPDCAFGTTWHSCAVYRIADMLRRNPDIAIHLNNCPDCKPVFVHAIARQFDVAMRKSRFYNQELASYVRPTEDAPRTYRVCECSGIHYRHPMVPMRIGFRFISDHKKLHVKRTPIWNEDTGTWPWEHAKAFTLTDLGRNEVTNLRLAELISGLGDTALGKNAGKFKTFGQHRPQWMERDITAEIELGAAVIVGMRRENNGLVDMRVKRIAKRATVAERRRGRVMGDVLYDDVDESDDYR